MALKPSLAGTGHETDGGETTLCLGKEHFSKAARQKLVAASESKGKSLTDADVLLMNSAVKGS